MFYCANQVFFQVYAGVHDFTTAISENDPMYAADFIHRDVNYDNLQNNIAMLVVYTFDFSDGRIGPVCLPQPGQTTAVGTIGHISGWGHTSSPNGEYSTTLQELDIAIIDNEDCDGSYGIDITDDMMCSADTATEAACNLDGGGPLTVVNPETNRAELIGLIAYSACGNAPTIYMKIANYIDWINYVANLFGLDECLPV